MKKIVLLTVALAMLVSLGGCYWPGHWHHHGYGGDRYYDRHDRGYRHDYHGSRGYYDRR